MFPARLSTLLDHVRIALGASPGVVQGPPSAIGATDAVSLDADPWITGLGDRGDPRGTVPGRLCLLDDRRFLARLHDGRFTAVLCPPDLAEVASTVAPFVWVHPDARAALAALLNILLPPSPPLGVSDRAWVHPGATVHATASVAPFAVVEEGAVLGAGVQVGPGASIGTGVIVGADTALGPRAVLAPGSVVGARCRIDAGAVVGAHGFGYLAPDRPGGVPPAIPHVGGVILEDDVHVGALATIARGTLGPTVIRRGARLDAHVHVGHNSDVGECAFLAGQSGLAGSVTIGPGAMLGGQAGVADHLTVGASARIAAASGVTSDVPAGGIYGGYPARPRVRWLRATARMYRGEKP